MDRCGEEKVVTEQYFREPTKLALLGILLGKTKWGSWVIPSEGRSILNKTNKPASMLVIANY